MDDDNSNNELEDNQDDSLDNNLEDNQDDSFNDNIENHNDDQLDNNFNNSYSYNTNNNSPMSGIISLLLIGVIVLIGLFAFNIIPSPFGSTAKTDIAFQEKSVRVQKNSSVQLSLTNEDSGIRYQSSDDKIATVNEYTGYVTGVSNGTATITAYKNNKEIDSCTIEVYTSSYAVNISSIQLSESNVSLYIGNTKQLKVTISPSNATNRKIIWSTSNKNVATINSNGVITGVSAGTATIKVRTEDNVSATCTVTVSKKSTTPSTPSTPSTPVTRTYTLTYNANGGSVSPTSKTLNKGSQYGTLPTPTRSGYTFNGWYTTASGGSQVSASTTISANTTIYAHWTQNSAPPTNNSVNKIHFIKQASSDDTDKSLNNGDAILLESNGHYAMIDTGLNNATDNKYVLSYLKSVGVTKLDFVLITHIHRDHLGGLSYLLKNIPITKIYFKTYLGKDNSTYAKSMLSEVKSLASKKGTSITYIDKSFKDGGGFNFQDMKIRLYNTQQNTNKTVHYDKEGKQTSNSVNENSNTVIELINVKGYKILLTGDLYDEKHNISLLKSLSATADFKNLDVLKMPHHGSTRSAFGGAKEGTYNKEAYNNLNPKYVVVTSKGCKVCSSLGAKNIYYARKSRALVFTFGSSIKAEYVN